MDHVDCIVVGAGVVGITLARAMAGTGREVLLLEANDRFGAETSSRNNEVIHAGFLYPFGSLKARLCRSGRDALYRYCEERGIAHRRVGKLMIATTDAELVTLRGLSRAAPSCGIDDLIWLDANEASAREPNLHCLAALYSPSTGIVDAHALMLALIGDAEAAGAMVAYRTYVGGGTSVGGLTAVETIGADGTATQIRCRTLINAAGLGARAVAQSLRGRLSAAPEIDFAKGNFFSYAGARPFETLIVPLAETLAGGGAFTFDIGGQGKFGPDLEWVDRVDYSVGDGRAAGFVASIQRYFPDLDPIRLTPNYAGIRPRVRGSPDAVPDWMVLGPSAHGLSGVYHLLGFDTPGLTACLAIADHVSAAVLNEMEGKCRHAAS
jgi:L-2-hydroxyglutarate oxidase LhgO